MNGTTPSPFLHPAIYPLGLEIALQLQAITHPHRQPHTIAPQLKKNNSWIHFTLRSWLPAAIFNENLTAHICIQLIDLVLCHCVMKYWCMAPLRAEPVRGDTLGRVCGRKGTDNKQIGGNTQETLPLTFALERWWKNEQLDILRENRELRLHLPLGLYHNW